MPLDRQHVTIASRVMLKVYPAFAAGVGLSFILTPRHRLLASPTLRYLDWLFPLSFWGLGFVLVAAFLTGALIAHHRPTYKAALSVMGAWMGVYAVATALSAFYGEASFSAWTWPAFIACACWATLLSLSAKEA